MSKGTLNRLILLGNLGADPEIRSTNAGGVIATLSIATTDRRKDKAGEWIDVTEWHRVTLFGRAAETARDYLRKGSKVLVEGHMRTRQWQDQSGTTKYQYEMFVEDMQMLGAPGGAAGGGDGGRAARPQASAPGAGRFSPPAEQPFDDDIPF